MSIEENKNIVRRYQEIHNSNDLDALGEVVADQQQQHHLPQRNPGQHALG